MVSYVMGAAMIGTMYFLRANCAQHGGSASGGGLISASLLSYRALGKTWFHIKIHIHNFRIPPERRSRDIGLVQIVG